MLFVGTSITCRSLIINIRTYSNEVILIFNACKMSPKFIIFNFFLGGGGGNQGPRYIEGQQSLRRLARQIMMTMINYRSVSRSL